ncbi:protein of unknown function [Candidatus Methylomirabilis oxygeniifera]|uniref:Uncharacterized protein n=1 Tax=Methylomirabilis oxygeniifera TaxID=671143 RepID=D5MEX6_METO1|nr:protein of unknown function [Candidatus Methylomirabilis oxyfera]
MSELLHQLELILRRKPFDLFFNFPKRAWPRHRSPPFFLYCEYHTVPGLAISKFTQRRYCLAYCSEVTAKRIYASLCPPNCPTRSTEQHAILLHVPTLSLQVNVPHAGAGAASTGQFRRLQRRGQTAGVGAEGVARPRRQVATQTGRPRDTSSRGTSFRGGRRQDGANRACETDGEP